MKNILFVGATGMLGKPVAQELLRAGFHLTLFGRDAEKMKKAFPNLKAIEGDVFDKDSIEGAMKDQEIVYMNLSINQSLGKSGFHSEREGINNIIASAQTAGVKRICYISSLIKNYQGMNGFNWWAFDIKHKAIDAIKKSGINYSIFHPSTFMESLDKQMLQGSRLMLAGKSEAPMWFIAAQDYGIQVAWALKKAGENNQEYAIQGLEPFTFDEAARVFVSNAKKKIKIFKAPLTPIKLIGKFNQKINYAANILEALNKFPEKFESETTWNDLGKPTMTLAQYAAAF